jgi:hypothetical protein
MGEITRIWVLCSIVSGAIEVIEPTACGQELQQTIERAL